MGGPTHWSKVFLGWETSKKYHLVTTSPLWLDGTFYHHNICQIFKIPKEGDFCSPLGLPLFALTTSIHFLKKQNAKQSSFICIYLIFPCVKNIILNYAKGFRGCFVFPCFKNEQIYVFYYSAFFFANLVLGFSRKKVCWLNFGSEEFPLINLPSHQ